MYKGRRAGVASLVRPYLFAQHAIHCHVSFPQAKAQYDKNVEFRDSQ